MKVFRALKMLWPRPAALLALLGAIAAVIGGVQYWLVPLAVDGAFVWLMSGGPKGGCPYQQVLAKYPGISGFNVEVRYTDCWIVHEMGVFGFRPGQREKTPFFLYDGLEAATVTSVDERTIKIALDEIDGIYCVTDKWQGLNIQYDIRIIRHAHTRPEEPGSADRNKKWSEGLS